jgi:nicotinamide mononucleotide adenylyltransferase
MIELGIKNEIKKPCKIYAIPDIHDEKNWVEHVEKCVGKFDVVYTGNDWVKRLFEEKGYEVREIKIEIKITGTKLRKMINKNNEEWKKFVPKNLIYTINKFNRTRI